MPEHAGVESTAGTSTDRAEAEPEVPAEQRPSRRKVLRAVGVGAATVAVAAVGAASYRAFDNGVLDSGAGAPYDPWSHWRDDPGPLGMVAAAILAANPHNIQPWVFHVTPERIDLRVDDERTTGAIDPLGRERHVGLGCALENLVLAAGARGYAAEVELMPDRADSRQVARINLQVVQSTQASSLYDAIGRRHSNRGPYRARPVRAEILTELAQLADRLPGTRVRWFASPPEKAAFTALLLDATDAVVADQQQSLDGFVWFRSSRDTINNHRDGLTLDGQGLGDAMTAIAKLVPATSRTAGDRFWRDQTRTVHTRTAAAYGVITVADPGDPVARLTGGRLLERIHLSVTARGLALQHMNQITERIDRDRSLGREASFAPRLAALLDAPGEQALVSFRIGYSKRQARLSPRRALEDVLR